MGRLLLVALPFAPRAPGALSAGGFILDDLESGPGQAAAPGRARRRAVGVRARLHLGHAHGRHARVARRGHRRDEDVASAPHVTRVLSHVLAPSQVSADGHTAYDIVFLDLPPDDSPDAIPGVAAALHEVPGLTVRIGRRPRVLRRRPGGDRAATSGARS